MTRHGPSTRVGVLGARGPRSWGTGTPPASPPREPCALPRVRGPGRAWTAHAAPWPPRAGHRPPGHPRARARAVGAARSAGGRARQTGSRGLLAGPGLPRRERGTRRQPGPPERPGPASALTASPPQASPPGARSATSNSLHCPAPPRSRPSPSSQPFTPPNRQAVLKRDRRPAARTARAARLRHSGPWRPGGASPPPAPESSAPAPCAPARPRAGAAPGAPPRAARAPRAQPGRAGTAKGDFAVTGGGAHPRGAAEPGPCSTSLSAWPAPRAGRTRFPNSPTGAAAACRLVSAQETCKWDLFCHHFSGPSRTSIRRRASSFPFLVIALNSGASGQFSAV